MIEVTFRYVCTDCQASTEEKHRVPVGGEIPRPCPPAEWRRIDCALYCPKHKIGLVIDDRPPIGIYR